MPATDDQLTHRRGGPGTSDPERISYSNISLSSALRFAYGGLQSFQVAGPGWITSNRYEIAATLPPGCTQEQLKRMLLNLLTERFHITVHHESKKFDTYELTVAKDGPKLKESDYRPSAAEGGEKGFRPDPTRLPGLPEAPGLVMAMRADGPSRIAARAQSISDLAARLQGSFRGIPVLDRTGLSGKYDFIVTFDTRSGGDATEGDIFIAIQEQIGLKLEAKKAPFDVIVVDQADPEPSAN